MTSFLEDVITESLATTPVPTPPPLEQLRRRVAKLRRRRRIRQAVGVTTLTAGITVAAVAVPGAGGDGSKPIPLAAPASSVTKAVAAPPIPWVVPTSDGGLRIDAFEFHRLPPDGLQRVVKGLRVRGFVASTPAETCAVTERIPATALGQAIRHYDDDVRQTMRVYPDSLPDGVTLLFEFSDVDPDGTDGPMLTVSGLRLPPGEPPPDCGPTP